jgi:enoyl-CoA hydratase/carnithine racemase
MSDALVVEHSQGTLQLMLNRPARRNALSVELMEQLESELLRASGDTSVRAVILTGAGGKSFCSGMDLEVLHGHLTGQPGGAQIRKLQRWLQEVFCRLEELEKPTICAVEGACVGGGLELALACDFRVAAEDAFFGFPEVKIGMLPDLGGTTRLARMVGPSVAKEWLMTGRSYSAAQAQALGLVSEVVKQGAALEAARKLGEELAANAPVALAWCKRVVDRGLGMSIRDSLELEQDAMTELLPSADLKEGVEAFLQKRKPKFSGR